MRIKASKIGNADVVMLPELAVPKPQWPTSMGLSPRLNAWGAAAMAGQFQTGNALGKIAEGVEYLKPLEIQEIRSSSGRGTGADQGLRADLLRPE